jgi:hypothetical protein
MVRLLELALSHELIDLIAHGFGEAMRERVLRTRRGTAAVTVA